MRVTPIVACLCVVATAAYELRVIHTNDIHAHLDEFNEGGIDCRQVDVDENTCYGGIARMRTAIDRVREEAARVGQETLLFDAGDQFQGTLFFNVYKSAKITEFMNAFQYDLMCIGNHEFDESEEFLFKFFESLSFPVVSANIDLNTTKFLHRIVKPYVILEKYKLGVIGFITKETQSISMGARGITFLDPVGPVQQAVDELHRQGIRRIIAVSHNGFKEDQYLAAHTHGIALIVGGHSHSLLLNEPNDDAVGRYPTPVVNTLGKTTYVVQAHRYGDYLGNVLVEWDDNDDVVSVEGDPIRLDQSIPKHAQTADDVAGWRLAFDYLTNSEAGKANASFEGDCVPGRSCPMAELVADAMLAERRPAGAQIALINAGGIRAHLSQGGVTCGDVLNVLPFGNTITDITLTGQDIIDIIESNLEGLTLSDPPLPIITSAHWAGVRYSYRSSAPPYRRVVFIDVADVAGSYTRLVPDSKYVVVTDDFIAWGGDNFFVQGRHDVIQLDLVYDVVVRYIQQQETISPAMDGRVQAVP